ncbi:MAG: protease modulator HflC [Planctomycetaceae bacterium]
MSKFELRRIPPGDYTEILPIHPQIPYECLVSVSPSAFAEKSLLVRRAVLGAVGILTLCLAPTCLLFVDETELVLRQRFGRIVAVYDQPGDQGPHLKWPWPIETAQRFDRRLQVTDPPGRELFTRDRKNLIVEAYIGWRIAPSPADDPADPLTRPVVRFYRTLGRPETAEARLGSRLQAILTAQIGQMEMSDLIAARNSEAGPPAGDSPLNRLAADLKRELNQRANESSSVLDQLGIEIVDVRVKRLNLPSGNLQAVYERMRSERLKIAERYRSAGSAESRLIRSQAERQATEILAQAQAEAERIKGMGEADALRILNEAHAEDPAFYETIQALDAYRRILNDQTTLVLSASSRLWKLLTDGPPEYSPRKPDEETKP